MVLVAPSIRPWEQQGPVCAQGLQVGPTCLRLPKAFWQEARWSPSGFSGHVLQLPGYTSAITAPRDQPCETNLGRCPLEAKAVALPVKGKHGKEQFTFAQVLW